MTAFEVGKTYSTRSIGDHNCIIRVTIAARTAKTITTQEGKRLRIFVDYHGDEAVRPWGRFSMSPTVSATDTQELEPDEPGPDYQARLRSLAETKYGAAN